MCKSNVMSTCNFYSYWMLTDNLGRYNPTVCFFRHFLHGRFECGIALSNGTLRKICAHYQGDFPLPHYRVGGKLLVKRDEFDCWMIAHRVGSPTTELNEIVESVVAQISQPHRVA